MNQCLPLTFTRSSGWTCVLRNISKQRYGKPVAHLKWTYQSVQQSRTNMQYLWSFNFPSCSRNANLGPGLIKEDPWDKFVLSILPCLLLVTFMKQRRGSPYGEKAVAHAVHLPCEPALVQRFWTWGRQQYPTGTEPLKKNRNFFNYICYFLNESMGK